MGVDIVTWVLAIFTAVMFVVRFKSLTSYIEATITWTLDALYPLRDIEGRTISGPRWRWPNGNIIDKFICGRQRSKEWAGYGSVYRVWAGFTPEVVITNAQDVRAFYTDSHEHVKARSSNAGWLFHQILGDCMGLINGGRWDRVHSEFWPTFMHKSVVDMASEVQDLAVEYVKVLPTDEKGGAIPIRSMELAQYPFFVTARFVYGPMTATEKERLWSIGQKSLLLMRAMSKALTKFRKEWFEFNEDMYQSRAQWTIHTPIVSAWACTQSSELPHTEVLHTLSEMLFANLDVTTHVLVSLLVLLGRSKQTQDEIYSEMHEKDETAELYCGRKDTLLHYSYLESLRLRPFTIFSIPESSPSEKMISNYKVSPTTSVIIDTLKINVDNPFWGLHAREFQPKRFTDLPKHELRYNFFTYGLGTRKCLGQHLAESMIKAMVYHVLLQFRVYVKNEENEQATLATVEGSWVPISDVVMLLQKRDEENTSRTS